MPTSKIYLDLRRSKDAFGIIKILIIHNRTQRMYSTGIKIKEDDFKKFQSNINEDGLNGKVKNQEIINLYKRLYDKDIFNNIELKGYVPRTKEIISELGNGFTFEKFKFRFDNYETIQIKTEETFGVISYFNKYIEILKKEERIGSALAYRSAINSIKRFLIEMPKEIRYQLSLPEYKSNDNKEISFEDITADFLEEYEKWMLKCGKKSQLKNGINSPASITSVGVNLRQLRTIFNIARNDNFTSNYPFGKKLYQIPAGNNTKKALTKSDIQKILAFKPDSTTMEQRSHDLWVFSYLGNGMNLSDICLLKKEHFDKNDKSISFIREKTKRTNKRN